MSTDTEMRGMPADLSGQRLGRLLAISSARDAGGQVGWLCQCDCGRKKVIRTSSLNSGRSKSCGCILSERLKQGIARRHGFSFSPTYRSWAAMVQRCTNPKDKGYLNYGGRGIQICNEWMLFDNFLKDMGECSEGLTLERIDVNGHYTKNNCKWVSQKDQMNNMRKTIFVEIDGRRLPLQVACEFYGVAAHNVRAWVKHKNMTYAEAILECEKRLTVKKVRKQTLKKIGTDQECHRGRPLTSTIIGGPNES